MYQKRNILPLLLLCRNISVYGFMVLVGIYFDHTYIWIPIFIILGFLLTSFTVVMHETCHYTFFKSKILNHILGRCFALINFEIFSLYRDWHYWHHSHTVQSDDSESEFIFTSRKDFILQNILYFRSFRVLYDYYDFYIVKRRVPLKKEYLMDIVLLFIWLLILLILIFIFTVEIFLIYVIPYFISNIFSFTLDLSEHYNTDHSVGAIEYSQSTRTTRTYPIIKSCLFSINYHIEHHEKPYVPFFYLEKIYNKDHKQGENQGYFKFWIQTFKSL